MRDKNFRLPFLDKKIYVQVTIVTIAVNKKYSYKNNLFINFVNSIFRHKRRTFCIDPINSKTYATRESHKFDESLISVRYLQD